MGAFILPYGHMVSMGTKEPCVRLEGTGEDSCAICFLARSRSRSTITIMEWMMARWWKVVYATHFVTFHDDVIKWKHFPRYWPFVRGIHRSPVNYPHKGQWRGALMFSLICVWINGWVNNRKAGGLRRYRTHYDVIVMFYKDLCRVGWGVIMFTNHTLWYISCKTVGFFSAALLLIYSGHFGYGLSQ